MRVFQVGDKYVEASHPKISGFLSICPQLVDPLFGDEVELIVFYDFDRVNFCNRDGFF